MITVAEAAARMGLSDRRVRALIGAGALPATKVGAAYVLDERALDDFLRHERPAHVRALSPRIGWAAAALLDGVRPAWLRGDELSRLRSRLSSAGLSPGVWRAWTANLAAQRLTFRASAHQIEAVLTDRATVRSGRSASNLVTDPLVGPVGAVVWVPTLDDAERLRLGLGLLRTAPGNLTLSVPPAIEMPALGADGENAFRLVVAGDLLSDNEPRATSAGTALLRVLVADARSIA